MGREHRSTRPRMFTHVLQAISDLGDAQGSTVRKILDQVQSTIVYSKGIPKPRNTVMEVQRALKHGVTSGVLRHKAGKYKLSFGFNQLPSIPNAKQTRSTRGRRDGKIKKALENRPKRIPHSKNRKMKDMSDSSKSHRTSQEDSNNRDERSSTSSRTSTEKQQSEVRISGRPKRRGTKLKEIKRPQRTLPRPRPAGSLTRRPRRPNYLPRKTSPEPQEENLSDANMDEEQRATQTEGLNHNIVDRSPDEEQFLDYNHEQSTNQGQCDNPECLCNLKQEPDENHGENNFNGGPQYS